MTKSIKILLVLAVVSMLATSCSRKIVGARVHRRDRHCGCELVVPTQDTIGCRVS